MKVGDKCLVFDTKLWNRKDVGDNSQFFKEATILEIDSPGRDQTAVVKFDHDERISRGHFTSMISSLTS